MKTFFRYKKNSHQEFVGVLFEGDSGAKILDLRMCETDERGLMRDSEKLVFKINVESCWIIETICREARAAASKGAR